jgi:hypothetical protein
MLLYSFTACIVYETYFTEQEYLGMEDACSAQLLMGLV